MSDLLEQASAAKQSGDVPLTQRLLSQALIQNPRDEAAWMMMADVVHDVRKRRECLQRVLSINPGNLEAAFAISKLDTSPLQPLAEAQQEQPAAGTDKIPPFAFSSEEEQSRVMAEVTAPSAPEAPAAPPAEAVPAFDWSQPSSEPDKAIEKIFEAVKAEGTTAEKVPETDLSWMDTSPTVVEQPAQSAEATRAGYEWLEEPEQAAVEAEPEEPASPPEYVTIPPVLMVEPVPEIPAQPVYPASESEHQLWENPRSKKDRIIILSSKSVLYADPAPADIPHIRDLFSENRMARDLLGEKAGVIRLESIQNVTAIARKREVHLEFMQNRKLAYHKLTFQNRSMKDEFITAFEQKVGSQFKIQTHSFNWAQKLLPPLLVLAVVAGLTWCMTFGLPVLKNVTFFQSGVMARFLSSVGIVVDVIGGNNIFMIGLGCAMIILVWLASNLSKPSKVVTMKRTSAPPVF